MGKGLAAEGREARAERLGRALRDNLRRRKAQARARLETPQDAESEAGSQAEPASGPRVTTR